MVEITIYILLMLLSFTIGHILSSRAYTLGLKHSYELKHDVKPTTDINPIAQLINRVQDKKSVDEQDSIYSEYLYGKVEE